MYVAAADVRKCGGTESCQGCAEVIKARARMRASGERRNWMTKVWMTADAHGGAPGLAPGPVEPSQGVKLRGGEALEPQEQRSHWQEIRGLNRSPSDQRMMEMRKA